MFHRLSRRSPTLSLPRTPTAFPAPEPALVRVPSLIAVIVPAPPMAAMPSRATAPHSTIADAADPDYCRVCFDPSSEAVNPIVFCSGCADNCFHADCYYHGRVPDRAECALCKATRKPPAADGVFDSALQIHFFAVRRLRRPRWQFAVISVRHACHASLVRAFASELCHVDS